jgi:hypothetical protein
MHRHSDFHPRNDCCVRSIAGSAALALDNFHPIWSHAVSIELDDGPNRLPADQCHAAWRFVLPNQLLLANNHKFRNSDWRDYLLGTPSSVPPQRRAAASADSYSLAVIDVEHREIAPAFAKATAWQATSLAMTSIE